MGNLKVAKTLVAQYQRMFENEVKKSDLGWLPELAELGKVTFQDVVRMATGTAQNDESSQKKLTRRIKRAFASHWCRNLEVNYDSGNESDTEKLQLKLAFEGNLETPRLRAGAQPQNNLGKYHEEILNRMTRSAV